MDRIDPVTERKIQWMVDSLSRELESRFTRWEVEQVMRDSVEKLAASATVFDYVPVMAHRFARERLQSRATLLARSGHLTRAA